MGKRRLLYFMMLFFYYYRKGSIGTTVISAGSARTSRKIQRAEQQQQSQRQCLTECFSFLLLCCHYYCHCCLCVLRYLQTPMATPCHILETFPMQFQVSQLDTPHRSTTVDFQEHLFASENQKSRQTCDRSVPSPSGYPLGARGNILSTFEEKNKMVVTCAIDHCAFIHTL
jgi:hypothetical protein